ncbi:MAG: helix-turn-helix transcriptional regulator [Paludibacteraceae bacterium]|nr:helix-turn-helix transcriptional regulator [Paludibacteraceae bacterium]
MKDRILRIIEDSGLTTTDFAVRVNVQPSQISHIKTGRNQVTLDIATKILKAYPKISPDWLLFGNGEMYRNQSETTEIQEDKPQKKPYQLEMGDLFANYSDNPTDNSTENELTSSPENLSTQSSENNVEEISSPKESPSTKIDSTPKTNSVEPTMTISDDEKKSEETNKPTETPQPSVQIQVEKKNEESPLKEIPHTYVKKIVVFYSDKTYEEFIPSN